MAAFDESASLAWTPAAAPLPLERPAVPEYPPLCVCCILDCNCSKKQKSPEDDCGRVHTLHVSLICGAVGGVRLWTEHRARSAR